MILESAQVNHYAVLIGINSYPERPLQGCVQDVQEINSYLVQAISPITIQIFTASERTDSDASFLYEDSEVRPTYENVTAALRLVNSTAKAGDHIYIHFSGHGTKTEPDDECSNESIGDLALVLLDKRDENNVSYLTGPKLARYYLNPMVQKGLFVTLVLDCCFAASVYRRDGVNIRYLPYNARNDTFKHWELEAEKGLGPKILTRDIRDASMRLNWLMDPDGYAILAACGPNQEGGEMVLEGGVTHGKLSYFLRQSFNGPGGCKKTHDTIYQYLCATLQSHSVRQNPVLYGRKDRGFFGKADMGSNGSLQVFKTSDGELHLLAGQAHGFCQGDRFALSPSACDFTPRSVGSVRATTITHIGPLTSTLEAQDMAIYGGQKMWAADPLTRIRYQDYLVHLNPDLPKRDRWKAALLERSLVVVEDESVPKAIRVTSSEDGNIEIRNEEDRLVCTLVPTTQDQMYVQAAETIEQLIKFAMVRDLAPASCEESFQKCFKVYVISCKKTFDANAIIEVKHGEKIELVLENSGKTPLFVSIYDLGPSWQIQNLLRASYQEIPPPESGQRSITQSKKITMTVPEKVSGKGLQVCEDVIKIFVTSQLSLFGSLELPKLGEALETAPSKFRRTSWEPEHREDWAALNFRIRVSLQ